MFTVGVVDPDVIRILTTELPYRVSQQLFNVQLKEICRLAGITNPVKAYKTCEKTRRKVLGIHPKISCSVLTRFKTLFCNKLFWED